VTTKSKQALATYKTFLGELNVGCTLESLNAMIAAHLKQCYFSSIPVLLKEPFSLEIESIVKKVCLEQKGGYCFEHNKLFFEYLKQHGFTIKALFARVLNNQDVVVPKTHRFSVVQMDDKAYLVDVGFGFASPNVAVPFEGVAETSLQRRYRVVQVSEMNYELQLIHHQSEPYTLYRFTLETFEDCDFEVANFYSSHHPNATFVNNLVLSKIEQDAIYSLRNGTFFYVKRMVSTLRILTAPQNLVRF